MRTLLAPVLSSAVLAAALAAPGATAQQGPPAADRGPYDILIAGGHVMDGSGNPAFVADVGIRDGVIVAVGRLDGAQARRTVDARGRTVIPGFIDLHSHGSEGLGHDEARRRAAPNVVTQGVSTVVINPDGRSPWPIAEQKAQLESQGIGPNTILMVGHGTVRGEVMGSDFRRAATDPEVRRMRDLVRQAHEEGAWGLSAGLEYVPGRWSTTDEVVALVEEIVPFGGVYIAHERSEALSPMWWVPSQDEPAPPTLLDAVRETIEIGERTGATVVASHIKSRGAHYWGSSHAAIQLIQRARDRGVDVWADQYPYTTSGSDGGTVLVPGWAIGRGGPDDEPRDHAAILRATLQDPAKAADVRRDVAYEMAFRGGPENIVVFDYPDSSYVGRTVAELAAERDVPAVEMAIALQLEGYSERPGGARVRSFSMWEEDLDAFARQPWTATASDGGIALPEDGPTVHARYYGTFPRKIRHYAMDRGAISVEHAIRAGTSLPAQILGLRDRGLIREGLRADVAVIDLERIRDRATFFEPHQYSEGVELLLVGGVPVVEGGQPTWELPGRVLTPAENGRPVLRREVMP